MEQVLDWVDFFDLELHNHIIEDDLALSVVVVSIKVELRMGTFLERNHQLHTFQFVKVKGRSLKVISVENQFFIHVLVLVPFVERLPSPAGAFHVMIPCFIQFFSDAHPFELLKLCKIPFCRVSDFSDLLIIYSSKNTIDMNVPVRCSFYFHNAFIIIL